MSVRYTEIVMPVPDAMGYRPSREDIVRLVDLLQQKSWIRRPVVEVERNMYLDPTLVRDRLKKIDPEAPFALFFASGRAPSPTGTGAITEWPEDDGCFRPELCEDVKIVWATTLGTPRGEGFEMVCPKCGHDLRPQMSDAIEQLWQQGEDAPPELRFIDDEYMYIPPERCAGCSAAIDLREVSTPQGTDEVVEEAPFAMFMLNFQAQRVPQAYPVYMENGLMESLESLLGVGFRSVGRFS